jgi:hypothetical protein
MKPGTLDPADHHRLLLTRRHFFSRSSLGIGTAALAALMNEEGRAAAPAEREDNGPGPGLPHFAPKAKRVIYLFQSGGPSQLELFDHKPQLEKYRGQDLPESVRGQQRLTGMTAFQSRYPMAPSLYKFARHGQSGATLSELLPHTAKMTDDLCFIKSMHTEQINHDPAVTFSLTGFQLAGRPSMGLGLPTGWAAKTRICPPSWSWFLWAS